MSQFVETNTKTFTAGAAIGKHIRVKLSSGTLAAAGVADDYLGWMEEASFASGDVVRVRLRTCTGTVKMYAAGAITAGARVYAAASGKCDDAITTELLGLALEAAGDADEIIEVLPISSSGGYRIARGQHTTVDADDTVVTGLNTVVAAVAQFDDAPIEAAKFITCTIGDQAGAPAAGSIQIKTHKDTDADAAIVDATTFSKKINWIAIGT